MKFCIMGDVHGEIHNMYKFVQELENRYQEKFDALIHVGDFGIFNNSQYSDWRSYLRGTFVAPIPTWVCPGNHESHKDCLSLLEKPVHNIKLLRDGEITDVLGFKVGAVWGNMGLKDWNDPRRLYARRIATPEAAACTHIDRAKVEHLQNAGKFDMLITHDCPVGLSPSPTQPNKGIRKELGLDADEPAAGCPGFNELYKTGEPLFHFFGHFHRYQVMQQKNPVVIALGCFNYNRESSYWIYEV